VLWLHALVQVPGISRIANLITKYEFLGRIDLQYGRWATSGHRRAVIRDKEKILKP